MRKIIILSILIFASLIGNAANYNEYTIEEPTTDISAPSMTQESFESNNTTLRYWLYTPAEVADNMPLLIYLHGGSGKGDDLNIVIENGFPKYLHDGDLGNIKSYVIIPQLPKEINGWLNVATTLRDLISSVVNTYHCDNSRISITGHSMGGTGTWAIAAKFPDMFHRIAPLSGSIANSEANIQALKESNIWAFVGSADIIVKPQSTIDFINSLNSPTAKCTIINGATHFDVPEVYLSQEYKLVDWLLEENSNTSVRDVYTDKTLDDAEYYDLLGRKINKPTKGLYIHKGKLINKF